MTPRRLELDYVAPRRRVAWVGLAVLALGIVAAAVLLERYRAVQHEFARLQASQRVAGAPPRPARTIPKQRIDDEYKQVESAVHQLTLPWGALIQSVEEASSSDVAVLQLQPEAQQRRLRLTAEAKDHDAMLAYLRRLGETKLLHEVHLLSHQVQLEDPQRPTQFSLQASLKGARPE